MQVHFCSSWVASASGVDCALLDNIINQQHSLSGIWYYQFCYSFMHIQPGIKYHYNQLFIVWTKHHSMGKSQQTTINLLKQSFWLPWPEFLSGVVVGTPEKSNFWLVVVFHLSGFFEQWNWLFILGN